MIRERWNRFFFSLEPVYAAVYFRQFLTLWTLAFFIPRLPYLEELYTARAIHTPHPLLDLVGTPLLPLWAVQLIMASYFVCSILFLFGIRPRALHLLILAHLCYLMGFDISLLRGYGMLAFYQWLVLWAMPYDGLRSDTGTLQQAPRWGLQLARLLFTSVYFFTIPAKLLGGDGWLDGRTLYYAMKGHDYGQFGLSALFPLSLEQARVLGLVTLANEALLALGLWIPQTRPLAMFTGAVMHTTMACSLRVSPLFHVLMIGQLGLFIQPSGWRWIHRRLGGPLEDQEKVERRQESKAGEEKLQEEQSPTQSSPSSSGLS